MLERGERARLETLTQRLATLIWLRVAALRTELSIGSVDFARLGLVSMGVGLQSLVLMSPGHFRPAGSFFFAGFVAAGTLGSLALCLVATTQLETWTTVRVRQGLSVAALLVLAVFSVMGVQRAASGVHAFVDGRPYNNDGAVMDVYAAQRVLQGHNPYAKTNIVQALAALNAPATTTTPLMDGQFRGSTAYPAEGAVQQVFMNVLDHRVRPGVPVPPEFESKYNYPAGSFLFVLPFIGVGINDLRFLYVLFLGLIGVYLWQKMPRSLRVLVPLLLLADLPLITLTTGGQPDTMYGFFLLLGLAEWRSPWLSPVAMGVAVGTKQLAWFFLPFYLLLIARELGLKEAARRSGGILGIFLLLNAPFILESPSSYVSSIAGPMTDPMFPLGIGFIALFVSGVLPMLPKIAFTLAQLAAWSGGLAAFIRRGALPAASIAVLGALPLFFAWRSLVNYFYLVPLLALGIALASRQRSQRLA
jgi:hypothetical protein